MEMEKEISILNIDDILPNRFQPRIHFNDKNINELADSIKEHGVIQPIVVRKISDKFEIIAGERRYKASIIAGKTTIPAIITNLDDKNSAEIALIENVQRQDLTPIEEAVSYKKILDMGYLKQGDLAGKLGKTQSTIANKLRLLNLDEEVQEALLEGKISERHARSLLRLDVKNQIIMLNRIIDERLTVRKADEEIDKMIGSEQGEQKIIEESEGISMNDKIINQFNIPVNPIIEEPVIEERPTVNPGFMDVSKIETQAEDIFKEEKPADMTMLLEKEKTVEPVMQSVAMQPIEPVEEIKEQAPTGGRFFTMFNLNNAEQNNQNFVEDIESKEANMDFGIPESKTNLFNPVAPVAPVEEQVESAFAQFNINPSILEPEVKEEVISAPTFSVEQAFNNVVTPEPIATVVEPIIEPAAPVEQMYNPFGEASFKPVEEVKEVVEEPVAPAIETPSVPDFTTVQPFVLNEESEFTNDYSVPTVENEPSTINSYNSDDFKVRTENEIPASVDFRTVINLIRDCSNQIEKYGYTIDTEEIDFENMYQVIFKIDKK